MSDEKEEINSCNLEVFLEAIHQIKDIYLDVSSENCEPCSEMNQLIHENTLPHEVVSIPEDCDAILNYYKIDAFPTVIKLHQGEEVARYVGNPKQIIERMKNGE